MRVSVHIGLMVFQAMIFKEKYQTIRCLKNAIYLLFRTPKETIMKLEELKTWDSGTGYALRDWLHSQGYQPEEISLFNRAPKKSNRGTLYQRIDNMVQGIPEGQLATYGQIAKLVGACGARQVGYAMAALGDDSDVPWHRVIKSQGRVSARKGGEGHELQRIILEAEGVVFNDSGKVNLEIFRWPGPPPEE